MGEKSKIELSERLAPLLFFPLAVEWEEKVTISRSP